MLSYALPRPDCTDCSMLDQLPTLGVGVSLSLASRPDPATLVRSPGGPRFVEYAGLVDADRIQPEVERIREAGATILFHPSYINFCGSFPNNRAWLETTAEHIRTVGSPWFAQDCAYCFREEGPGYSTSLGYFIPPILNEASLQQAIRRVQEVREVIPVPVAIEPPPMTFVVGSMPLFTFFGRLAAAADCAILLDMGHLVSWEMAGGGKVLDHLHDLDCRRVVEVHIAGGRLKSGEQGPIYVDAHECPILDQSWRMLETLLPQLPNVKAVCYECEGMDEETVLNTLQRLRGLVRGLSVNAALVAALGDAP